MVNEKLKCDVTQKCFSIQIIFIIKLAQKLWRSLSCYFCGVKTERALIIRINYEKISVSNKRIIGEYKQVKKQIFMQQ